eukprot:1160691-Pelagomonas_calceolata.AAC.5
MVPACWAAAVSKLGKGVTTVVSGQYEFNKVDISIMTYDRRGEHTKTASGRLWCQAEGPVPLENAQLGTPLELFLGTSMPCSSLYSKRHEQEPTES